MAFIVFDTETGGIGLDKSLLDVFFILLDDNLEEVDTLKLSLKPNDGIYHVNGEGMSINQIDLRTHSFTAIPYKEGGTLLYEFLRKYSLQFGGKLIPIGHVINGDIAQIIDKLVSQASWESFVSYRTIDTACICKFLQLKKLLPSNLNGSLASLVRYFNIVVVGIHHEAEYDTRATLEVFKKLIEL